MTHRAVTHRAVTHRAVTVKEDLRARTHRELPQYDERFRAVEKTPGRLAKFSSLPTGRDLAGDESTSSSEGTGSEWDGLDDDADAWWNAPFGTLTFAEGLKRTPRKVKKRTNEKENAAGTKRRTKTAAFASPANKPGRSKPHEPTKGATRGEIRGAEFEPGRQIEDATYVRPDGTLAVFLDEARVEGVFGKVGLEGECRRVTHEVVNRKLDVRITRSFVQGRFTKKAA